MADKKLHRVRIVNEDGVGYKTKITNADTGEEIPGVFRLIINNVNDVVKAQIMAYATFDMVAEAEVTTICPYCKQPLEEGISND